MKFAPQISFKPLPSATATNPARQRFASKSLAGKNPYKTTIFPPDLPAQFLKQARKNSLGRAIKLNIADINTMST